MRTDAAVNACGDAWLTQYVRDTCELLGNNALAHVLGVEIGDDDVREAQFRSCVEKVDKARAAIAAIGDAGTELVLTRRCADVCKVTHLLRAHGTSVSEASLADFDRKVGVALGTALGGPLHQEALDQASLGGAREWPGSSPVC